MTKQKRLLKIIKKRSYSASSYEVVFFYLGIFFLIFFFIGLDFMILKGPYGVHFMRQTDCLSFSSNYFNNGFHFFKPQLFTLNNNEGRAACEFPITYYLTALIYLVIGKQLYVQRFIHLAIAYFGVFYTFKLTKLVTKDNVYSVFVSLIFFTSTVFNYYSFNYLPDAPALGFALIGWFFIIKSFQDEADRYIITGFIFFTLSGLIKVTYLINPISVIVVGVISKAFPKKRLIKNIDGKIVLYGLFTLLIVSSWYIYVLWYNKVNHSHSFNTTALPIWLLDKPGILQVWEYFTHYWHSSYFYQAVFNLFYLSVIVLLFFHRRLFKPTAILLLFLFLGNLTYFILFFKQFKDHDYYFLVFFPFIFLVVIYSLATIKRVVMGKGIHFALKLILFTIIIFGLGHSRKKIRERVVENKLDNKFRLGLLINENMHGIDRLDIDEKAKFIVAPENCANGSLFFLNRMGWPVSDASELTKKTIMDYSSKGAEYLLVADDSFLMPVELESNLIYCKNGLRIWKLIDTE